MKNLRVAFELYEGKVEDINYRYQEVSFHIIFDENMEDNFCRKFQMVSGGQNFIAPSSLTYYSVVYG